MRWERVVLPVLLWWGTAALAQEPVRVDTVYTAVTAGQLTEVLTALGYTAEQGADAEGEPLFALEMRGLKVRLFTYGCATGACQSLQLYAGFAMTTKPPMTGINDWNQRHRYGRAYVDAEGDPVIETDLDLAGGVSAEAVARFIRSFGGLLDEFVAHIGFR